MPISSSCKLAKSVKIYHPDLVNIYGCIIGDDVHIGPFVEIQKNVVVGKKCKITSHSFICEGVEIEDQVFVGHGVVFINDKYPTSTTAEGKMQTEEDWQLMKTLVKKGASIGSNATIMGGITIGKNSLIGAGSVITKDVPDYKIIVGYNNNIIGDTRNMNRKRKRS